MNVYNYIFLKTWAVMCDVIQLLYSNACTRDQYPFNGQMRTGTGMHYTSRPNMQVTTVIPMRVCGTGVDVSSHISFTEESTIHSKSFATCHKSVNHTILFVLLLLLCR